MALCGEVEAEVGLVHRRDRMAAHRVTIDALDNPVGAGGKQIAERDVAAEVRRANYDWHKRRREYFCADLDGSADAAVCW